MSGVQKPESIWTPANIVTLIRIGGVPIFVAALLSPWPEWLPVQLDSHLLQEVVAAIIFAILACTDGVDGYLARSRNEVTNFGKFIDPLADKILVAAALLALVELSALPSWVALIILAREFIVSGLRMIAASQGEVIAASWYGKAKTVTQIIAIILFLLKRTYVSDPSTSLSNPLFLFAWFVMIVALALTIISMMDYFWKCRGVLGFKTSKDNEKDAKKHHATAQQLVELCAQRGLTVCTAESLTGGMISAALTAVPGSSSAVKGGVASYTNQIKHDVLGVDDAMLAAQGAVTKETAVQMAEGVRRTFSCDMAVSVTGIAGPTGAQPGKPVGTVWMAVSTAAGTVAREWHFQGDRDAIRSQTVDAAIDALYEAAQGC